MIYHVYANRSNIGDWLSARGIQKHFAADEIVELLCDEPFVPDTIDTLSTASHDDLVIIGGGGLFMDYFLPFWESFEPLSKRLRFAIWGVGCCNLKRGPTLPPRELLEQIVSRAELCVVRDDLTREYLGNCAVQAEVPCPSVAVIDAVALGCGVLHVDAWDNVGEQLYAYMHRTAQESAARTGRPFASTNNLIRKGDERDLQRVLSLYRDADVILTGRLHGCIIGLAMGRKVVAVSGDRKLESFMSHVGLSDWVCDLGQSNRIPTLLARAPEQRLDSSWVERARAEHARIGGTLSCRLEAATSPVA
jgi:polysaccharide pyruvyl transferase WcaK-like protein